VIGFIRGKVFSVSPDNYLLLDCNNIGFKVYYPHIGHVNVGDDVMIFTYMVVKEDDISLYGFENEEELNLFVKLINVKGLGPKTAINILTYSNYSSLITSIQLGDIDYIKRLPGIGAKTASQIILDLKGKLVDAQVEKKEDLSRFNDVVSALKSLGYKNSEINPIIRQLSSNPDLSDQEYLRLALKMINNRG
jgi:Holliday junction DNA helicase RuvA